MAFDQCAQLAVGEATFAKVTKTFISSSSVLRKARYAFAAFAVVSTQSIPKER
jgi:hypothetical protein